MNDDSARCPDKISPCSSNETMPTLLIDARKLVIRESFNNISEHKTTLSSVSYEEMDLHDKQSSTKNENFENDDTSTLCTSVKKLSLNDQISCDTNNVWSSHCADSEPSNPLSASLLASNDDPVFAKRLSYNQAVHQVSRMRLPSSLASNVQQNGNQGLVKSKLQFYEEFPRQETNKKVQELQSDDVLQDETVKSFENCGTNICKDPILIQQKDCNSIGDFDSKLDTTPIDHAESKKKSIDEDETENIEDYRSEPIDAAISRAETPTPFDYPEELNPFAEVSIDDRISLNEQKIESQQEELVVYHNPFEDDEREDENVNFVAEKLELETSNPFWDAVDEDEAVEEEESRLISGILSNKSSNKAPVPLPRFKIQDTTQVSALNPRHSVNSSSNPCSKFQENSNKLIFQSESKSTSPRKKKPPPPPPVIVPNQYCPKDQESASPMLEKKIPSSVGSCVTNIAKEDLTAGVMRLNIGNVGKRKKGPAPARPTPQRRTVKKVPFDNIQTEIGDIQVREQELERQSQQLEQLIREKTEIESAQSQIVEEMVLQLFELVNKKNELFRKRSELMNMRKMIQLEEEHADLEYRIRCLIMKPESNKTDNDKLEEEELIKKLLEVVERRNEIIEAIEKDRQREVVEDCSINTQLGIFTSNSKCIHRLVL